MGEARQHAQLAQTLRCVKPLPLNNNGTAKMDLSKCDASLPDKHDSISTASTAIRSPATSFGEGSDEAASTAIRSPATSFGEGSDEGTPHHVVQELDSWITQQQPERNPMSGEWRDDEQERKVLLRTSSECSEYWTRMQEETRPRSRAASIAASTDYDFRPRTPSVLSEYRAEYFGAAPPVCTAIVQDESQLAVRNKELEDRVAELERKLLELAAQKGAA